MAETNKAKAAQRRDALAYQVSEYRQARRQVALRAMRLEQVPPEEARRVSFHALNLAELASEENADG